jgi:hypothetical protein
MRKNHYIYFSIALQSYQNFGRLGKDLHKNFFRNNATVLVRRRATWTKTTKTFCTLLQQYHILLTYWFFEHASPPIYPWALWYPHFLRKSIKNSANILCFRLVIYYFSFHLIIEPLIFLRYYLIS